MDLTYISEVDLLQGVVDILMKPGGITDEQRVTLDAINQELARRDAELRSSAHALSPRSALREIKVG